MSCKYALCFLRLDLFDNVFVKSNLPILDLSLFQPGFPLMALTFHKPEADDVGSSTRRH